mmetsp:Transcript_10839/g.23922  ORF Transcript_10839/g.23922 Transcript_10839/m.23922 type:complete len:287 (-) Transcript_10839:53-913(-)
MGSCAGCCGAVCTSVFRNHRLKWQIDFQTPSNDLGGCLTSRTLFAVRVVLLLTWFGFWLNSLVYSLGPLNVPFGEWCSKFTNWTATLELIYLCFLTFTHFRALSLPALSAEEKGAISDRSNPWFANVAWYLQSTITTSTIIVTLIYWLLVHKKGREITVNLVALHGGGCLLSFVEVFISQLPFQLSHGWLALIVAATYLVYTAIFYGAGWTTKEGDRFLYSILDWSSPGKTIVVCLLIFFVAVPLVYFIVGFFIAARNRLSRTLADSQQKSATVELSPANDDEVTV